MEEAIVPELKVTAVLIRVLLESPLRHLQTFLVCRFQRPPLGPVQAQRYIPVLIFHLPHDQHRLRLDLHHHLRHPHLHLVHRFLDQQLRTLLFLHFIIAITHRHLHCLHLQVPYIIHITACLLRLFLHRRPRFLRPLLQV